MEFLKRRTVKVDLLNVFPYFPAQRLCLCYAYILTIPDYIAYKRHAFKKEHISQNIITKLRLFFAVFCFFCFCLKKVPLEIGHSFSHKKLPFLTKKHSSPEVLQ